MATIGSDRPESARDEDAACGIDSAEKPTDQGADCRHMALYAGTRSFDDVFSLDHMVTAGRKCCNGVRWKTSTIAFENDRLHRCYLAQKALREDTRKFKRFHTFYTIEHGKCRQINALDIDDRMMQKCLVRCCMRDAMVPSLIADNSASLPGRGMDYAIKRLKKHLHDHYRKHGTAGGIYQYDFHSYFASIPHDGIKAYAHECITDQKVADILCSFVDDFNKIPGCEPGRGVGLGSEISQPIALYYASCLDHYIKDRLGIHGYGRYNDDGYVISNSLMELAEIRNDVHRITSEIGIEINKKKDIITPFRHHSFRFLKLRIRLTESGRIVMKLSRQSVRGCKRKITRFREEYASGNMNYDDIYASYQSWRSYAEKFNSCKTVQSMNRYFYATIRKEDTNSV